MGTVKAFVLGAIAGLALITMAAGNIPTPPVFVHVRPGNVVGVNCTEGGRLAWIDDGGARGYARCLPPLE